MSQEIYRKIAKEIEESKTDSALWTQAFAECDGDADKTKALYIRLRYAELSARAEPTAAPIEPPIPKLVPKPPARPPTTELDRLRVQVKAKLTETGRSSFYQLLGLEPDAGDADVAATIAKLKGRVAQGEILSSEVGYALDAFATPDARENYDRRLLGLLAPTQMRKSEPVAMAVAESPVFEGWWKTRTGRFVGFISTVLIVVFAFGTIRAIRAPKSPSPQFVPAAGGPSGQYVVQPEADQRAEQQARDETDRSRMAAQQSSALVAQSSCQQEVDRYRAAVTQARENLRQATAHVANTSLGAPSAVDVIINAKRMEAHTANEKMAVQNAERDYAMAQENCRR